GDDPTGTTNTRDGEHKMIFIRSSRLPYPLSVPCSRVAPRAGGQLGRIDKACSCGKADFPGKGGRYFLERTRGRAVKAEHCPRRGLRKLPPSAALPGRGDEEGCHALNHGELGPQGQATGLPVRTPRGLPERAGCVGCSAGPSA